MMNEVEYDHIPGQRQLRRSECYRHITSYPQMLNSIQQAWSRVFQSRHDPSDPISKYLPPQDDLYRKAKHNKYLDRGHNANLIEDGDESREINFEFELGDASSFRRKRAGQYECLDEPGEMVITRLSTPRSSFESTTSTSS